MPNKNDSAPYNWPKGQEEGWFASRIDTFPNGTRIPVYTPRVFDFQVKNCLDKICASKRKVEKK